MFLARKIARETLPIVVIAWATFVLLGGAMKAAEKSGSPAESAVMSAGFGLCAVSVAAVFGTGLVKRVRLARRTFVMEPRVRAASLFSPGSPRAYTKPPPGLHPLRASQVSRT